MFPIYGSGWLLMKYLFPFISHFILPVRLVLYVAGIFTVEYIIGWALDVLTGKCPWEYHSPYAVNGYINLAYTPLWMLFGFALEILYHTVQRYQSSPEN